MKTEMEEDDRGVVLPGTEVIGKPKRILKFIGSPFQWRYAPQF